MEGPRGTRAETVVAEKANISHYRRVAPICALGPGTRAAVERQVLEEAALGLLEF